MLCLFVVAATSLMSSEIHQVAFKEMIFVSLFLICQFRGFLLILSEGFW